MIRLSLPYGYSVPGVVINCLAFMPCDLLVQCHLVIHFSSCQKVSLEVLKWFTACMILLSACSLAAEPSITARLSL